MFDPRELVADLGVVERPATRRVVIGRAAGVQNRKRHRELENLLNDQRDSDLHVQVMRDVERILLDKSSATRRANRQLGVLLSGDAVSHPGSSCAALPIFRWELKGEKNEATGLEKQVWRCHAAADNSDIPTKNSATPTTPPSLSSAFQYTEAEYVAMDANVNFQPPDFVFSKELTDQLFSLAKRYNLNFHVVLDRLLTLCKQQTCDVKGRQLRFEHCVCRYYGISRDTPSNPRGTVNAFISQHPSTPKLAGLARAVTRLLEKHPLQASPYFGDYNETCRKREELRAVLDKHANSCAVVEEALEELKELEQRFEFVSARWSGERTPSGAMAQATECADETTVLAEAAHGEQLAAGVYSSHRDFVLLSLDKKVAMLHREVESALEDYLDDIVRGGSDDVIQVTQLIRAQFSENVVLHRALTRKKNYVDQIVKMSERLDVIQQQLGQKEGPRR